MDTLPYEPVKTYAYKAKVIAVRDILSVLSSLYPVQAHYQVPRGARSTARPVKRGWYVKEEKAKRRRIDLDERRTQAVEQRRAQLEAHPDWPTVQKVVWAKEQLQVFGDFSSTG